MILEIFTYIKTFWCLKQISSWKIKDETVGVAIEDFGGLKQKMHSFLVDDNSEYKKAKDVDND